MGPAVVVELDILVDEMVDVPLAEQDEVVQALVLQRFDRALCVGVQIGRVAHEHDGLDRVGFEDVVERPLKLLIPVAQKMRDGKPLLFRDEAEIASLLSHPFPRGVHGRGRDVHPAGADVNEQDGVELLQASVCESPHAEEIARPQGRCVHLEELVPASFASMRIGRHAGAFEDVRDSTAGEFDAELFHLALDAGVAEPCFTRDADDDLADVLGSLRSADLGAASLVLARVLLRGTRPAGERPWADNRDDDPQNSPSQGLAEVEQSRAFLNCHGNTLGQLASQDAVLGFEELDLREELLFVAPDEEFQERIEEAWHGHRIAHDKDDLGVDTVFGPLRSRTVTGTKQAGTPPSRERGWDGQPHPFMGASEVPSDRQNPPESASWRAPQIAPQIRRKGVCSGGVHHKAHQRQ